MKKIFIITLFFLSLPLFCQAKDDLDLTNSNLWLSAESIDEMTSEKMVEVHSYNYDKEMTAMLYFQSEMEMYSGSFSRNDSAYLYLGGEYVGIDKIDVAMKVDDKPAVILQWHASTNGKAIFYPGFMSFLAFQLIDSKKVVFRVSTKWNTFTLHFNTGGLRKELEKYRTVFKDSASFLDPKEPDTPAKPRGYNIGDKGPGGGTVFFNKGNDEDHWQYVEVADFDLGTATFSQAVSMCSEYEAGGYFNWRLPTSDELKELNMLVKSGRTLNFTHGSYWEDSPDGAKLFNFTDRDSVLIPYESTIGLVRPVRYFR